MFSVTWATLVALSTHSEDGAGTKGLWTEAQMGHWWGRGSGFLDPASSRSRVHRAWMGTHMGGRSGRRGVHGPRSSGGRWRRQPPLQGQTLESTDTPTVGALAFVRESPGPRPRLRRISFVWSGEGAQGLAGFGMFRDFQTSHPLLTPAALFHTNRYSPARTRRPQTVSGYSSRGHRAEPLPQKSQGPWSPRSCRTHGPTPAINDQGLS